MPTDSQSTGLLLKKYFNTSSTADARKFYEEPIFAFPTVYSNQIASGTIPATSPLGPPATGTPGVSGNVELITNLSLINVAGTTKSFYHANLKLSIPFNFDIAGSYLYKLKKNDNSTIFFGEGDWIVDNDTGVLTFYGTLPAGVSAGVPPKISFYRYIGALGISGAQSLSATLLIGNTTSGTDIVMTSGDVISSSAGDVVVEPVGNFTVTKTTGAVSSTVVTGNASDVSTVFQNSGAVWSAGIDTSDSDAFIISRSATLGTNTSLKIDSTENVSIPNGTLTVNDDITLSKAAGSALLTISTAAGADSYIRFTNSGTTWSIGSDFTNSNRFVLSNSSALGVNDVLNVSASNTGAIRLGFNAGTQDGNICIGNQSGTALTGSGSNVLIGNRAGIAITSGVRNSVIGFDAADTITTGSDNVIVGANAGGSMGINATFATVVGQAAGTAYTGTTGIVAVGNTACSAVTSGVGNVGVGTSALSTETTGANNTAVGHNAGKVQNGGADNTLIGFEAGDAITTGSSNTLIGSGAGGAITSGARHLLIGHRAGELITTNSATLAIGYEAGKALTSGLTNTLIGYQVAPLMTSGSINTVFGNGAAANIGIGNSNTLIGATSGNSITSGSNNTCVGYLSNAAATATDCISLGYNSSVLGNDCIAIGSGANTVAGTKNIVIGSASVANNGGTTTNAIAIGYKSIVAADNSLVLGSINGVNTATVTHKIGRGISVPTEALHIHDPDGAVAVLISTNASGGANDVKMVMTADADGTPESWAVGIDASNSNHLTFSHSATLGTSNILKLSSTLASSEVDLELNPNGVAAGDTSEIRFKELAANGANYVGFKAADLVAANVIWTLPVADGSSGQFLQTNGTGALSFASSTTSMDIVAADGAVSLATNTTLFDSSSETLEMTLADGSNGQVKSLALLNTWGNRVVVQTDQGKTYLDTNVNRRDLIFSTTKGVYFNLAVGGNCGNGGQDNFYSDVQQARVIGTGVTGVSASQGTAVCLSADGNTLAVGGPADDTGIGAVWIFIRSPGATSWSQQAKIVGTGATGAAAMGSSVALSADGNTLVFGGPANNSNAGRTWIWVRSGVSWSEQTSVLGASAVGNAKQGTSVAISADGNKMITGGPEDTTNNGAVWYFTRSGVTWTPQGKIIQTNTTACKFGFSVSLDSDAKILVGGAPADDSNKGAVFIFRRSQGSNTWVEDTYLVGSDAVGAAQQGTSVAISKNGKSIVVGGPNSNTNVGRIWVWQQPGTSSTWEQQATFVGSGGTGSPLQGSSVAISADGNTVCYGGSGNNGGAGAVWVWTRSANEWYEASAALVGTGGDGSESQGSAVTLNSNGSTMVVGGPTDGTSGAVWVYV